DGIDLEAQWRALIEYRPRAGQVDGRGSDQVTGERPDGASGIGGIDPYEHGVGARVENRIPGEDAHLALFGRIGRREPDVRIAQDHDGRGPVVGQRHEHRAGRHAQLEVGAGDDEIRDAVDVRIVEFEADEVDVP